MKTYIQAIAAVSLLSLAVAGCTFSGQPNGQTAGNPSGMQEKTTLPPTSQQPQAAEPSPSAPKSEQAAVEPGRSESGSKSDAVEDAKKVQKEYRLNKVYDVVPIDPSGNKKVVLLTFDDGPKEKDLNEKLLDVLDKHKAKAIFFVNGYRIKKNPDLLKLIHSRGQVIGNHSWDHIDLKKEASDKIDKQIRDVQNIVKELTGSAPVFFRPPYGSANDYVKQKVKEEHMLFMTWSNGSEDWLEKNQNPQGVIKRVLEQLRPGSNILMHELPWTAEALDELLTKLEEKGYSFVDPRSIETETN